MAWHTENESDMMCIYDICSNKYVAFMHVRQNTHNSYGDRVGKSQIDVCLQGKLIQKNALEKLVHLE